MSDIPVQNPAALSISESAARRIQALRQTEGNDGLMLRVSVSGGGCSGFQYGFDLTGEIAEDDVVIEQNGVGVVVDTVSLDLLRGARVDYVEELIGAYFTLENPNAASTCGCGGSFSL